MVARQVFDKLPALSPMITCDTEPFDNPVENSTKRRRPAWSEHDDPPVGMVVATTSAGNMGPCLT
jgi:hypothetical protein